MNLLITGALVEAKKNVEKIEKMGHSVCFMQYEKDALPCEYSWVEGVICNGLFLSHSIEMFSNLQYIQLTSAGFDRVPMDYVKEHDIKIYNARGVYSIPMAEFAITGVLYLYKQIRFFSENQKKHRWEKHRGLMELCGKTVCIVGCGSVGTECAKRFQVFGCKVIGIDLFPREDSNYVRMVELSELDAELPQADVVVLTLPLTDESRHMMNKQRFDMMKDNAIVVNIARGAIVDMGAMIDALSRIGGAVIDVFEEEPLDEHSQLWSMKNAIVTPHNSFIGENNSKRLWDILEENLKNYSAI